MKHIRSATSFHSCSSFVLAQAGQGFAKPCHQFPYQKDATKDITAILHEYVPARIEQEDCAQSLVNLRVEFNRAGNSCLELAIMADFKGELGDLYNRLRRAIQRWCVDASTENGWEIPFPQLTVHGIS